MALKVSIDEKTEELVVRIPLMKPPRPSASGKSTVLATTGGNVETDCKYDGHTVRLGLNAYVKVTNPAPTKK